MNKEKQKKELRNQRRFVESWLSDPEFTGWLHKEKEETKARCSVCHKTIEWLSSGRSALTDHAKGKKHKEILSKKINFFLPKNKAPHILIEEPTNSVVDGQQTLEDAFVWAEIIWTLKTVMSGYSVRSNNDLSLTFAAMFPELKRTFNLARTKSMYMINHGIAPYSKSLPKTIIDRFHFRLMKVWMKQLKLLRWTYMLGFGMSLRTKSMFAIMDQAVLAMAPIQTYSHISVTLLKAWAVICIKHQWTALMLMQNFIRNFKHISKKAIATLLLTFAVVLYAWSMEVLPREQKNLNGNYKRFGKEHITFFTTLLIGERITKGSNWF